MLAAKTKLKNAQKVKQFLLDKYLLDNDYSLKKKRNFLYYPLKKTVEHKLFEVVDFELELKPKLETIESLLEKKLTVEELKMMPHSQEVVGDILILEIPSKLEKKEKVIGEAYLKLHKNILTVVKKTDIHSGAFRTRGVEILAGENKKETVHIESSVKIKLDLEKTYFSARLGHERLRIAKQVKLGENVLVMFSGSSPYPLILAKHSPVNKIVGVELNPDAYNFGVQNVRMNKLGRKVSLINGDVREVLPKMNEKFDRILMPLPKTGEEFLDVALERVVKGGIIHLYAFLNEKEIENYSKKIIDKCKELGYNVEIVNVVKCGQHAPYTFRVCYDLKIVN